MIFISNDFLLGMSNGRFMFKYTIIIVGITFGASLGMVDRFDVISNGSIYFWSSGLWYFSTVDFPYTDPKRDLSNNML